MTDCNSVSGIYFQSWKSVMLVISNCATYHYRQLHYLSWFCSQLRSLAILILVAITLLQDGPDKIIPNWLNIVFKVVSPLSWPLYVTTMLIPIWMAESCFVIRIYRTDNTSAWKQSQNTMGAAPMNAHTPIYANTQFRIFAWKCILKRPATKIIFYKVMPILPIKLCYIKLNNNRKITQLMN